MKKKPTPTAETIITSYKGFDKDLKCRGFQFEMGKEYDHAGDVKACESGFHACEYPLDVFNYYPPAQSVFAQVEQSGKIDKQSDDSKVSSSKIKIKAAISIAGIINAAIEYTVSRAKAVEGVGSNTGYKGVGSNTGDKGVGSNTGSYGVGSNTGDKGVGSNTGYKGVGSNTGSYGVGSNTGSYGVGSNTGYKGVGSNTGDNGVGLDNGLEGEAITVGGKNSVAVALGYLTRAKASQGNWIVIAHRDESHDILALKCAQAGVTKGIKADTFYTLTAKGVFQEVVV